jgi:hypothetical protein
MKPLRLSLTAISTALLLSACASPPEPRRTQESAASQTFKLCEAEGFMALNMARNYLASKNDKSQVLDHLRPDDAFANAMAQDLFAGVAAGKVRNHASFAADKLMACAARENVNLVKPQPLVAGCFARSDIPFFASIYKDRGLSRPLTRERLLQYLPDRGLYPEALVDLVVSDVYGPREEPTARLMRKVFWNCLYGEDWTRERGGK